MIESLIFYFLAAITIIPAILVVTVKNIFHASLFLIISLLGVAGFYAMLAADFVFAVQLMVYAGGIMVLLLFIILLSGKPSEWAGRQVNEKALASFIFSALLLIFLVVVNMNWEMSPQLIPADVTTGRLGILLIKEMLLPFEVIGVLMVVSLIGAVYFSAKRNS